MPSLPAQITIKVEVDKEANDRFVSAASRFRDAAKEMEEATHELRAAASGLQFVAQKSES